MTRDEFCSLPPMIALGLIYDVASSRLRELERPPVPRPPKYDDRFTRQKGKFCWVSEMTLDDLTWWRNKKAESAAGDGKYADSDRKWVAKLDKWVEWRRLFPYEAWSGTRGEERATGALPSREPALHPWGERTNGAKSNEQKPPADTEGRSEESEWEF